VLALVLLELLLLLLELLLLELLLLLPDPPAVTLASAGRCAGPLALAQNPKLVDAPAARVALCAAGVATSCDPLTLVVALHAFVGVEPFRFVVIRQLVVVVVPVFRMATSAQYPVPQSDATVSVAVSPSPVSG
jgi:hypothetical protein